MKKFHFLFIICLSLLSCNAKGAKSNKELEIKPPRQFKLTDPADSLKPGDYYLSFGVSYHFSGIGDENSMDETPYLDDSSIPTLDSIANFLKRNDKITISINYVNHNHDNLDSCVPCAFQQTIIEYLVSKGIKEERMISGSTMQSSQSEFFTGLEMVIN